MRGRELLLLLPGQPLAGWLRAAAEAMRGSRRGAGHSLFESESVSRRTSSGGGRLWAAGVGAVAGDGSAAVDGGVSSLLTLEARMRRLLRRRIS